MAIMREKENFCICKAIMIMRVHRCRTAASVRSISNYSNHDFWRALYLQTPNFKLPMAARDMEKDTEEEHVHFQNVIAAFQQYARYTVGTLRSASPPQAFT
jgi:hypothetical protein